MDIVLLGLHGAMVAQECDDCEGELIEQVRQIVGQQALIGVTFDPHSHLSQRRTTHADIITTFKEFPHTDFVETAENLIELVYRASCGEISPHMSVFDCRMIEIFPTSCEPMRSLVDRIKGMEGHDDVLSISIVHGFMAGDVPDLGTKVLVVSNHNEANGMALAQTLGLEIFALRGKTRPAFLPAADAVSLALSTEGNLTVLADVWDNPGGGAAGDSTIILRELFAQQATHTALATIWDPIAVRTCFSAGIDAQLTLRFGGKMSNKGGEPIDAEVRVRNLVRDATQSFGQSIVPLGDCAWIEMNGVDVILNTVRSQVFSPDLFTNLGIDIQSKSLLVVKSTNHFHAAFSTITESILYAAVDGPYPNDPVTNDYKKLNREIWPRAENPHGNNY